MYSHDTFGLGHLRRSRAIANALVSDQPNLSVVIMSGSPVIGNFDFGTGVDYVRLPGVVKQADGDYTSLSLNVGLDDAVRLREAIIFETARVFEPDVFIVDKEPTGFRGEILRTLDMLQGRGCRLVLGIRDVMDEPAYLVPEWERKGAAAALTTYYDQVWVYGLRDVYEPLAALDLPPTVRERLLYTGYLERSLPSESHLTKYPKLTKQPFLLVTTGGGGDGEALIDWVVSAYEADARLPVPALVVFGPFIDRARRKALNDRIRKLSNMDAIAFDSKIEHLMNRAEAVVAMGGYNTFCEVLSLDKRALIVPRTRPRLEQFIRASQAEQLGVVSMLVDPSETGGERDPMVMAKALRTLLQQRRPSEAYPQGLLGGLDRIRSITRPWLGHAARRARMPVLAAAAE
jgi:predicted glycosyltransferase